MSADNQQERLDANWIVGFVDGEGCFHVSLNKQQKMTCKFQVLPEFRVVQHEKDIAVLFRLKDFFKCGNIVTNHGTRKEFRVRGQKSLAKIVAFFSKYPLQTSKQKNFEKFVEVFELIEQKKHLTQEGIFEIAKIISTMNRASRILRDYTPNTQKCDDIVRPA